MLSFILSFKSLSFISIVWSSGQTNLSRKRSFSKMLFKEKTLKTRLCAILRLKENILKTEPKTRQCLQTGALVFTRTSLETTRV